MEICVILTEIIQNHGVRIIQTISNNYNIESVTVWTVVLIRRAPIDRLQATTVNLWTSENS